MKGRNVTLENSHLHWRASERQSKQRPQSYHGNGPFAVWVSYMLGFIYAKRLTDV